MYEQQRQVALTLQKALMGEVAPLPGVASASRYLPSTQGPAFGREELVRPDPARRRADRCPRRRRMGRGLEAAAVMGRLRSRQRAGAHRNAAQQLMHALDLVARDIPEQLTTCCYMIIDPQAGAR